MYSTLARSYRPFVIVPARAMCLTHQDAFILLALFSVGIKTSFFSGFFFFLLRTCMESSGNCTVRHSASAKNSEISSFILHCSVTNRWLPSLVLLHLVFASLFPVWFTDFAAMTLTNLSNSRKTYVCVKRQKWVNEKQAQTRQQDYFEVSLTSQAVVSCFCDL